MNCERLEYSALITEGPTDSRKEMCEGNELLLSFRESPVVPFFVKCVKLRLKHLVQLCHFQVV